MSSLILATAPIHGHVSAYLPLARHLVARGDRVRFVTGSRFAEVVAATGATHVPLPAESDLDEDLDLNALYPERATLRGSAAVAFDVETLFVRPGGVSTTSCATRSPLSPADVVVADPVFIGAAHLLGHPPEDRPGLAVGSHVPLPLESRDTAPYGMGLTPAPVLNRARNRVLYALAHRLLRKANALVDQHHQDLFGHPYGHPVMDWIARADAIAQFSSGSSSTPVPMHPRTCTSSVLSTDPAHRPPRRTGGTSSTVGARSSTSRRARPTPAL